MRPDPSVEERVRGAVAAACGLTPAEVHPGDALVGGRLHLDSLEIACILLDLVSDTDAPNTERSLSDADWTSMTVAGLAALVARHGGTVGTPGSTPGH